MKRTLMRNMAAVSVWMMLGWMQVAAEPAQPALPKGHPSISEMKQKQTGMMPALPAGHPDMAAMKAKAAATSQPAVLGILAVHAVQGTRNGPAIGADSTTIEAYLEGELTKRVEVKLDARGNASVPGIPFGAGYEQLVKISHGGVEFAAALEASNKGSGAIEVPVYESTDQAPAWQVRMWHMIVQPTTGGVEVLEVVAVENPTDRAWLGIARADGKHESLKLALPAGTKEVQLMEGFHDCCTQVDASGVSNTMPMLPGVTQFKLGYIVPSKNGKAEVTAVTPAMVKTMMVLVPNDGSVISAQGLEGPSVVNMGRGDVRYFKGNGIAAGKQLKITLPSK